MPLKRLAAAVVLAVVASAAPGSATLQGGYLPPVETDGMVFPVARSDWYSVINFGDDWGAPRMRFTGGQWVQAGTHEGTDIIAEPGTPVLAMTPGRVENIGWLFYSGWRVGIRDTEGRYVFYAHLDEYAPGLSEGDRVEAGDLLGEIGNTGYGDTGHRDEFIHHLHLGIQAADGSWINPYPTLDRLYGEAVGGS